jgi:hypothetical protein
LRAEPLIIGAKNLLPKVKGVGFHAPKHRPLISVCANDNCSRDSIAIAAGPSLNA